MLDSLFKRRPGPRLASLRGAGHVLPDFLLIGVQKGGTTSLYNYLAQHPDVLGVGAKELFYFDRRFASGDKWYRCWFPTQGAMTRAQEAARGRTVLTGEASTSYLDHPAVPNRAADLVPEAKIVAVLRDPAERALSHYFHNVRKGREPLAILDAFRAEGERLAGEAEKALADPAYESQALMHFNYLSRGHYAEHLERWATRYPAAQTLVLRSEDLFSDPKGVFDQTLDFLGLAPWTPEAFRVHNPGTNRREVADDVRAFLDAHYAPHNARLGQRLGPEFDWSAA
ncbi:MAG: sulfotransferase domain-containing protein [Bacteroidota bacterium]